MKYCLLILVVFILHGCTKQKTVFICGDHVCVNKKEAENYFKENLSIEVKLIKKDKKDDIDLVELNLKDNSKIKKISISEKDNTKKPIKELSSGEIKEIKKKLKKKKQIKKLSKSKPPKNENRKNEMTQVSKNKKDFKKESRRNIASDVCKFLDKCDIDEISKYLIKEGNKKRYPDLTTRE